jgi:hypothetical protein
MERLATTVSVLCFLAVLIVHNQHTHLADAVHSLAAVARGARSPGAAGKLVSELTVSRSALLEDQKQFEEALVVLNRPVISAPIARVLTAETRARAVWTRSEL